MWKDLVPGAEAKVIHNDDYRSYSTKGVQHNKFVILLHGLSFHRDGCGR